MRQNTQVDFIDDRMELTIFNIQFKAQIEQLKQKLTPSQSNLITWNYSLVLKENSSLEYSCFYDEQMDSLKFQFPVSITYMNNFPQIIDILKDRVLFQSILFESLFVEGIKKSSPIKQIEISPLYIKLTLVMPNFDDNYTLPYQFELTRFKQDELADQEEKSLKMFILELPNQLSNYLKPSPLNYGLMCICNLDQMVNLLQNCYLPLQVFQNILTERWYSQAQPGTLRLDKSILMVLRQLLTFLPTAQFGILSLNFKSEQSPLIHSYLQKIPHNYLCLALESVVENGFIMMTVKLNEQYQQFMMSNNQQSQINHSEFCRLIGIPPYLDQFRQFMGQILPALFDSDQTRFKLQNVETMVKFFQFLFLYLFITLIKDTYLCLGHLQKSENKLSHRVLEKFYQIRNSFDIDILRKSLIRILHLYQEHCAKSQLLFFFTHNQLCICYFLQDASKKFHEQRKRNEDKYKLEITNLQKLQDKLMTQDLINIKASMQQYVQSQPQVQSHYAMSKIDEQECRITFPNSNITLQFFGSGNDLKLFKGQTEDKNYSMELLTEQEINYIRDCVYSVGSLQRH